MFNETVYIVANFFEKNDTSRPYLAYNYFINHGYNVKVIYSTWSHSFKKQRIIEGEHFIPVTTPGYKSNISIKRIFSHLLFAIKSYFIVRKNDIDIVYINLPPNFLGLPLNFIKQKKKFLLITDVLDLWPESFPLPKIISFLFKYTYGLILKVERNKILKNSDLVITESDYFYNKLNLTQYKNSGVVHLKKISQLTDANSLVCADILTIGYIGNIGSVYDFESLIKLLIEVGKKREIELRIIGEGDQKEWLFNILRKHNIRFDYFGATFDEKVKKEVLESCWFGYNGFKENTEVALSFKTIEYFSFGLPILNSAKGDTIELVNRYNLGFNFKNNDLKTLIDKLKNIEKEEIINMKATVMNHFDSNFSFRSYDYEMHDLMIKL